MAEMATLATVALVASTVVNAGASIYQGYQSQAAAEELALQEESRGREEFAASQREADERRLEGQLIMSRQQAAAAASGAGAGAEAPTIVRLMSKTAGRTEYGAQSTLYGGQSTRRAYMASAAARRRGGQASALGGWFDAAGTVLGGVGRYAERTA